jgi:hypothetical protein
LRNVSVGLRTTSTTGNYVILVQLTLVNASTGDPNLNSVFASAELSVGLSDAATYKTLELPGDFTVAAGTSHALLFTAPVFGARMVPCNPTKAPTAGPPFTLINQKFTNNNGTSWFTNLTLTGILLFASAAAPT